MPDPAADMWTDRARQIILGSPVEWARFCVLIENKDKQMQAFDPNVLQLRMSQVYETMQELGKPTRILSLKPRQSGDTTISTIIVVHHCKKYNARATLMADDYGNSKNMYRMALRHCDTDAFPWGITHRPANNEIIFSNGSLIEQDTAQNPKAGISATRNVIHLSEVSKYPNDGKRDAYITIANMMASLNKKGPNSVAILETTADTASGFFYDQWQGAVTLDQYLAGEEGNGWVKVFAAWHEFDDHRITDLNEGQKADIMSTLTKREQRGIRLYQWTVEQIAWRRMILNECGGDERQLDIHYPEDPESCFLSSGTPRFDMEGLQALADIAKAHMRPDFGTFSHNEGRVTWTPRAENESSIYMYEEPREGMRYLVCGDCATGARYTRGSDPDAHSFFVLRAGYQDEHGRRFPPRVVCRLHPACRLDIDIIANLIERMSLYYGRCLIVPERNMGIALIEQLRVRDLPIYQEQVLDRLTSKTTNILGYETNAETKNRAIERLAALIRDSTPSDPKILLDTHTIEQCRTFVRDAKGNPAAAHGKHDDDVMAVAIGVTCIQAATTLLPTVRRRKDPPDRIHWRPAR